MFVDTSAVVAIIAGERDAPELAACLERAPLRVTSPLVRLEASVVLATLLDLQPSAAQSLFDEFLDAAGISVMPISDAIGRAAVDAFQTFGKGRHPARLNIADCFSYACARAESVGLLYKGDDFARTDIGV